MTRVLVGMSGGVDSSVAAALLVREGHDVIGISLQLYDRSESDSVSRCCSPGDLLDARRVASRLGIPWYAVNREALFERRVLADFVDEYRTGRTPNPCVRCNAEVKFESLASLAAELGADAVATGHYARLSDAPATGERHLLRARDAEKDQSYFLFDLTPEQCRLARFPLGEMRKEDVRRLARDLELATADKPDSQDVCFLEGNDYRAFIARRLAERGEKEPRGPMIGPDGGVVGEHAGLSRYTIGQRRGLRIASDERLYVVGLDRQSNTVRIGGAHALGVDTLDLDGVRFIGSPPADAFGCQIKVRYRHAGEAGRVTLTDAGRARVMLRAPVPGVSPGQAAVFYLGDRVLGGGWIQRAGIGAGESDPLAACATIDAVERA